MKERWTLAVTWKRSGLRHPLATLHEREGARHVPLRLEWKNHRKSIFWACIILVPGRSGMPPVFPRLCAEKHFPDFSRSTIWYKKWVVNFWKSKKMSSNIFRSQFLEVEKILRDETFSKSVLLNIFYFLKNAFSRPTFFDEHKVELIFVDRSTAARVWASCQSVPSVAVGSCIVW